MSLCRNHPEHEICHLTVAAICLALASQETFDFGSESSRTRDESSDRPLAPHFVTHLLSLTKSWGLLRPRLPLSSAPRAASEKVKLCNSRVTHSSVTQKKNKRLRSLRLA